MEKMDMVLCGAEGVVESGGIINKVMATYTRHLYYDKVTRLRLNGICKAK
jgi:hypothetical protein